METPGFLDVTSPNNVDGRLRGNVSDSQESSATSDYATKALMELNEVRDQSYQHRDLEKRCAYLLSALEHFNGKRIKNRHSYEKRVRNFEALMQWLEMELENAAGDAMLRKNGGRGFERMEKVRRVVDEIA